MSVDTDIYFEVRKHKESSDKVKAEDYAVLEAIEEIIRSNKGVQSYTPSSVEYFSCIMSSLSQSNDHYRSVISYVVVYNIQLLFLLQLVLPVINENVLRLKCNDCLDILLNLYSAYSNTIEPSTLRYFISCVCIILLAQETNNELWESNIVKRSFNLILSLSMHENGKVRRYVQESVQPLMELHYNRGFTFTSRQIVRQLEVLNKAFNEEDYHEMINYLLLVAKITNFIHASLYSSLFSTLLKVGI